jgi:hypothetical protein
MGTTSQTQTNSSTVSPGDSDAEDDAGPDRDELFHVLRNRRRRYAIHHLKRDRGPVDVGELATQVAAWENRVTIEEVTSTQRRRVYNALKQTHLPELNRTDLVEEDRGEVVLTDQAERLDMYLELVPERDIQWSEYYLGLGAVGLAVLTVAGLNVGPFGALPDIAVGVFLAVSLVVSSVAHYYFYQNTQLLGGSEKPPELRGE